MIFTDELYTSSMKLGGYLLIQFVSIINSNTFEKTRRY